MVCVDERCRRSKRWTAANRLQIGRDPTRHDGRRAQGSRRSKAIGSTLSPEPCERFRERGGEVSVEAHAGGPIESRNEHPLERRASPLGRKQHVLGRKGRVLEDSEVPFPYGLALRRGKVACRRGRFRLFREKPEFCPHGRMVAQFLLLAPIVVVAASQNLEVSRDEGMVETSLAPREEVGRLTAVTVTIGVP